MDILQANYIMSSKRKLCVH